MLTFVIYDISCTKTRNKIADICLDYGLQRIQLSAFEGFMSNARRIELARRVKEVLREKEGEVQILTACKSDWSEHLRVTAKGLEQKEYRKIWGSLLFVAGGDDK